MTYYDPEKIDGIVLLYILLFGFLIYTIYFFLPEMLEGYKRAKKLDRYEKAITKKRLVVKYQIDEIIKAARTKNIICEFMYFANKRYDLCYIKHNGKEKLAKLDFSNKNYNRLHSIVVLPKLFDESFVLFKPPTSLAALEFFFSCYDADMEDSYKYRYLNMVIAEVDRNGKSILDLSVLERNYTIEEVRACYEGDRLSNFCLWLEDREGLKVIDIDDMKLTVTK